MSASADTATGQYLMKTLEQNEDRNDLQRLNNNKIKIHQCTPENKSGRTEGGKNWRGFS